jgi:hypothetical protein
VLGREDSNLRMAESKRAQMPGFLRDLCSGAMVEAVVSSLGAILATAMANGKVGRNGFTVHRAGLQPQARQVRWGFIDVGGDLPSTSRKPVGTVVVEEWRVST